MADYVSLTAQRELKVYVPSVDIQDSIVRVLSPIDERILLNRKMNRALETAVTVLFRSWFVDFDPVTAKVERRKPFGISDDVASLFPSEFEEDIPAGWRLSTIGQEVRVVGGSTPSTNEPRFWNGLHHWLTPKDLSKLDDPFVVTTVRSITDKGVARISSGILPLGTVLLSSRAPIGYTAIAAVPLSINQGLIAMKAEKELTTYFVYHWVRENIDEILSRAGGTTFAEISKTSFRPIPVVVPSRSVIEAFDSLVNPMFERILLNMRQSASLQKLRNAILPPLISGELCVKEADKQVEAASV